MEPLRVLITDMPGPAWWEFFMQWGGLAIQALAAIATFCAVLVALQASRRDVERHADVRDRMARVYERVLKGELSRIAAAAKPAEPILLELANAQLNQELSEVQKATINVCRNSLNVDVIFTCLPQLIHIKDDTAQAIANVLTEIDSLRVGCDFIAELPTNYRIDDGMKEFAGLYQCRAQAVVRIAQGIDWF